MQPFKMRSWSLKQRGHKFKMCSDSLCLAYNERRRSERKTGG
jgi:hypothetical protein